MKRILFLLTIISLSLMMGCKKSSYVPAFDKSPQERVADQINLVSTTLTGATNGWIATLPTLVGGGYSFYMNFDNQQNVTMYGDMTDASSSVAIKSYYRVKQDIGIDLVFDSYTYISMLDDPNQAVLGGANKIGFSSDIDFIFNRSSADTIVFTGKKYRQPLKLVKATAAQKALYEAGSFKTAIAKMKTFFSTTQNPYVEIISGANTVKTAISINSTNVLATGKRALFYSGVADSFVPGANGGKFAFTIDGIEFLNGGITYLGVTFVKLAWKDATTLAAYDATGKEYIIKSSTTPAGYTSVTLADAVTDRNWGSDFITRRAQANAATLATSNTIKIGKFKFTFTPSAQRMDLNVSISIGANSNYTDGIFAYSYLKKDDGSYKFNVGAVSGNGSFIQNEMAPVTAQRLNIDTFKLTYYTDPVSGVVLGQFKSVEHPDFYFAGTLL
jgi:hypothetical protein